MGNMLRPAGAMGEGSGQLGRSSPNRQRLFIAASCFLPLRRLAFRIFLPDFVRILFRNPLTLCFLSLLLRLLTFIGSSVFEIGCRDRSLYHIRALESTLGNNTGLLPKGARHLGPICAARAAYSPLIRSVSSKFDLR